MVHNSELISSLMIYFGMDSETSLGPDTKDVHIQYNVQFLFTEQFASMLTGR